MNDEKVVIFSEDAIDFLEEQDNSIIMYCLECGNTFDQGLDVDYYECPNCQSWNIVENGSDDLGPLSFEDN